MLTEGIIVSPFDPVPDAIGNDVFGVALLDSGARGDLLVEREGDSLYPTSLRWWLRQDGASDPVDFPAISMVGCGPVLDIGCATGRHIEALGRAGLQAEGIDINPAAVTLARRHGCTVEHADFWSFQTAQRYRWLLAVGNNPGIAGRLAGLPALLRGFAGLLVPGGQVLLSSIDCGHPRVAAATRGYPGEMRLRHHYGGHQGPWFDWLYVTPETLATQARAAGFTCGIAQRIEEVYVAVLSLDGAPAAAE